MLAQISRVLNWDFVLLVLRVLRVLVLPLLNKDRQLQATASREIKYI